MTCEQLRDEYELYALGLADEPEKSALGAHLDDHCAVCSDGMRKARELVALIATTSPDVAPSPRLRRRIMASVGAWEPRGWGWSWTPFWVTVSALCLVVAVYFYGRERDTGLVLARFQEQARTQSIDLARLNEALALVEQPETRQVTFGGGQSQPPRGRVFVNPRAGVLLMASNLPAPPEGKTYEMWLIPKTGNPVPAGLFQSNAQGSAMHLQRIPVELTSTKAVAVTLEPAGGVPQPTSQPVIVAAL
jgi:anti-sigma-K factor RskA